MRRWSEEYRETRQLKCIGKSTGKEGAAQRPADSPLEESQGADQHTHARKLPEVGKEPPRRIK